MYFMWRKGADSIVRERTAENRVGEGGGIHFIVKGTASRSLLSPIFFIKQLLLASKHKHPPDIFAEPFVFSNTVIDLPVFLPGRSGGGGALSGIHHRESSLPTSVPGPFGGGKSLQMST